MIEDYEQIVNMVHDVSFGKACIALFDREKYLVVMQGSSMNLPVKAGEVLAEKSGSSKTIATGEVIKQNIVNEELGLEYYVVSYPIVVNGEVIGGIVAAESTAMLGLSEKLQDTAHTLVASMQQISAAIENIASSAQELANGGQSVASTSHEVNNKAEEMEEVVQYIDSVAGDTKLLGLNAAIEAARAGDAGRGFGVVAQEIRSMAVTSASSAKDIRKIIGGIRGLIGNMTVELEKFGGSTQEVSAAIEEIGASIEELTHNASQLAEMAKKL